MTPEPALSGALFIPHYLPLRCGDWELRVQAMGMFPGYWSGPVFAQDVPILLRGRDSWMSITPLDIESQEIGIRLARGHVLIFGLGMGWAAAATAVNPAVTAVTVVEKDKEVLALHHALDPFAQLPEEARAKLRLIEGDALGFVPERPVDLLMPDIWLPLVGDGRLDEVRSMQANVAAAAVYFWGQELEIARHAVAAGRALDDAGIAATVAQFRLPLVGLSSPGHAAKLAAAARRWMRGRWLAGSPRPW